MDSSTPIPKKPRRPRLEPWQGIFVAALVGCLLAVVDATGWAKNRREMIAILERAGIDESHPQALRRIEREGTPHHARLLTARSLVYDSLARLWQPGAVEDPALRAEVSRRLPEARALASSALESQPGSWQGAMLVGISTYLQYSLDRDRRLYTEAPSWEVPLQRAVERASGHPEPRRLLATAYVETWANLSDAKKTYAKELLTRVFHDDLRAFEALLPAWLSLRLGEEETFSVVPADAAAWQILTRGYAAEKRWGRFIAAHARYLDSLEQQLRARRQNAEERLRLGDFVSARSRFLQVISGAPVSGRFVPLVGEVLEIYPPGLHGLGMTSSLTEWLEWNLELGLIEREPMPPGLLSRLVDALGEIEAPKAALASRLADDPYQAERYEKLARPLRNAAWAPYLVVKARKAVREGRTEEAVEALREVSSSFRDRPPYVLTELEVARAVGDPERIEAAEAALQSITAERWSALDWRWVRGRPVLDFFPARSASGFELKIAKATRDGVVIQISLNGRPVAVRAVRAGETVRVSAEVEPEVIHLVEIRPLTPGGNAIPGSLRLLGRP